jgi:predicted DsbA family dithiol-disulfide isomerase
MDVAPGTIVVFGDIACPWATLAVERFHRSRHRLGLDVTLVHRAFPLELVNGRATPKPTLDAEVGVLQELEPEVFRPWSAEVWQWPVTTLLAMEAVKEGGQALDRALRHALFRDSRCVSLRTTVLEVAAATDGVDAERVATALDDGRHRSALMRDFDVSTTDLVQGSPHVFLPDGTDVHNPGIELHVEDGTPVIDADDPSAWDDLVRRAAR